MAMPQQVLKFKDSKGFLSDGLPFKDMGIWDGWALTVKVYKVPIAVNNTLYGKKIEVIVDLTNYLSDWLSFWYKKNWKTNRACPAQLFMNGAEITSTMSFWSEAVKSRVMIQNWLVSSPAELFCTQLHC
jgi:hypothetical protein